MNIPTQSSVFRNPSRHEIPDLLIELEGSQESVAEFARKRGLKPQALYLARRRLKSDVGPNPVFDRLRLVGPDLATSAFELRLKSGINLSVPPNFEASALRRLLQVLEA